MWFSTSATCTAQSVRPASPYSRVPSSGSTIQTARRVEACRIVLRLFREDRVVGSVLAQERQEHVVGLAVAFRAGTAFGAKSHEQFTGAARGFGGKCVIVHGVCHEGRCRAQEARSRSWHAARRSTPASTGFTSIASTSARLAEEPVGLPVEQQQDRASREPVAGFLEPQVDGDRDAAHVADLHVEDDEVGIARLHGVAHVLAARDLDDPLPGTDERRPAPDRGPTCASAATRIVVLTSP